MFTIGPDFGANSVRALIARCSDGAECGGPAIDYPSGNQGVLLDPNNGLRVARSSQGRALGSAIAAAVLAGAYPDFETPQSRMTSLKETRYAPTAENRKIYDQFYQLYRELHDNFGDLTKSADPSRVMKGLIEIKYAQRA